MNVGGSGKSRLSLLVSLSLSLVDLFSSVSSLPCRRRVFSHRMQREPRFLDEHSDNETVLFACLSADDANALISKNEQLSPSSTSPCFFLFSSLTRLFFFQKLPAQQKVLAPRPDRRGGPHRQLRGLRGRQRRRRRQALAGGQLRALLARGCEARDGQRRRRALPVEERGGWRNGGRGRSSVRRRPG